MDIRCSAEPCPVILNATCVFYAGENLVYTGIVTNDNLQNALQKIDAKFQDAGIGYIFNNGVIQSSPGNPVQLGGKLIKPTTIDSNGFPFVFTETLESAKFITTGGLSSQFVKGDGTLDSTSYQPTGNYITALTGDGTATGPNSAVFTLSNSGVISGTYGTSTQIPRITVDSKGRITSVSLQNVTYPTQYITLYGDVDGAGFTGTNILTTISNVNPNVFGTNTPLKFAVNNKGLITSAALLNNLDLDGIYGYTPVPNTRTITINGVTQNLANDRSWTITSSGVNWGDIIGTITNQTDLINYLSTNYYPLSSNPAGYLTDAPADGSTYGRNNNTWAVVTSNPGTVISVSAGTGMNFTTITSSGNVDIDTAKVPYYATTPSNGLLKYTSGVWGIDTSTYLTSISVGLSMPSAFTVTNSPVTSTGTLTVTGAGTTAQYIRGDGTLANFPNSTGGGSSINYYLNGSISQGTFGGDTYYEMSKTPILGGGTNFIRTNGAGNGYIASFITDAGDPSQLNIPGGNWNLEFYFQSSASGGSPQFYGEIYKVSATNVFTLVASGVSNPESITNGTTVDQYFTSIPVPQTSLLVTDRLAIRIYVITGGRTITLHTENGNLCEVLTTFSTGITALNGLTDQVQYFATPGTTGTSPNWSSVSPNHTLNIPLANTASVTAGLISKTDYDNFTTAYTDRLKWDGGATGLVAATGRTSLGATTVGGNFFTLTNPSAITFPRINADNTVSTLDASTFRTAIGAGTFTLPSLTSGSVLFSNGTTISQDNTNFFWDNTNKRLGIGTTTPAAPISLLGSSTGSIRYRTENSNSAGLADYIAYNSSSNYIQMMMIGSTFANFANYGKIEAGGSPAGLLLNLASGTGFLDLATNTVVGFRMFANNGNTICIQNGGTFTDSGDRLQVSGNLNLKSASSKIKINAATPGSASVGVSSAIGTGGTPGRVVVSTSAATTSSRIFLTGINTAVGTTTNGELSVGTITNNTSFEINSSNTLDTRTVNWFIIN